MDLNHIERLTTSPVRLTSEYAVNQFVFSFSFLIFHTNGSQIQKSKSEVSVTKKLFEKTCYLKDCAKCRFIKTKAFGVGGRK